MVPHVISQLITRKQHHCDSTINHKETTSHGAHDISLCTMTNYGIVHPIKQLPK